MKQFLTKLFSFSLILVSLVGCSSSDVQPIATATNNSVPSRATATQTSTQESTVTPISTLELVNPTLAMTVTPTTLTSTPQLTLPMPTITPPATPSPFTPEETEGLTFNLIHQQGGAISSVAVMGQTAVVGLGPRLVVIDITNPTEPQTLGQSEVLPGLVRAVLVRNSQAYVGVGLSVIILDISNLQSPSLVSELPLSEPVSHLALSEETLVVVTSSLPANPQENGAGTIATVDVSQPEQPQILDSVGLPWYVQALALANETIYASNPADTTFFAIDIGTPDNLPDPVPFPGTGGTYSLQARGQTLYVGGGLNDVTAWDVSDLAEPQKLWEIKAEPDPNFGLGVIYGFVFSKSTIYLNAFSYHGQIIGPLALHLPEPVAVESGDLVSSQIISQEDQLIISRASLDFYKINDNDRITLQASYRISSIFPGPTDMALAGRNGLVVSQDRVINDQNSRLSLVQLPELSLLGNYINERQCDLCDVALSQITGVADIAYTTGEDGSLRIFNISDPVQPLLVATYTPVDLGSGWQRIYDLSVLDKWGYAVGLASDRAVLLEFDLSDPHNVRAASKIYWPGSAERVAATENSVYVYTILFTDQTTYELRHFTRNDGGELTLTGSVAVASQIYDIVLDGDVVFLGTADGLIIVSTEAATGQPEIMAQARIPGGLWELALMGDVLLATTAESFGNGRLLAIDLQDLTRPRLIGATFLPAGKAQLAATDEGTILVGNAAMGLMVFEVSHE